MKQKLTIVKVGGAVVEDELQLSQLLKDFSAMEERPPRWLNAWASRPRWWKAGA